ncbi:MAG TPA: J domain-containing protein [Candidatus Saccharimonadales bacterium]|nr:J domain-containing protein [Candidatus Saccharimonadales bacterium]
MPANHYKILGLEATASSSDIKARYKELAKKYHPDRNGDAGKMVVINKAYSVLSDPQKRFEYNSSLRKVSQRSRKTPSSPDSRYKASQTSPKAQSTNESSTSGMADIGQQILGKIVLNPVGLFIFLFIILIAAGYLSSPPANG